MLRQPGGDCCQLYYSSTLWNISVQVGNEALRGWVGLDHVLFWALHSPTVDMDAQTTKLHVRIIIQWQLHYRLEFFWLPYPLYLILPRRNIMSVRLE